MCAHEMHIYTNGKRDPLESLGARARASSSDRALELVERNNVRLLSLKCAPTRLVFNTVVNWLQRERTMISGKV